MAGRHSARPAMMPPRALDPRLPGLVAAALAAAVFAGCLARIRQRWFIPGYSGNGYTENVVRSTAEGYARAPNQYRPLMPEVMTRVAEFTGAPLPTAILAVDAVLLVVLVALVWRLALLAGRVELMAAAAAVYGLWVAKLDHWHPEVMALTVLVTGCALLLWGSRPSWWALGGVAVAGAVMVGLRSDYAAALALVVAALGVARRDWRLVVTSLPMLAVAVLGTLAIIGAYPDARYLVAVQQWPYNLSLGSWLLVSLFYGPVVLITALAWWRNRTLPRGWFVLAWFGVLFAAVFVVGRVEESRIFLPLAPALGVAAGAAYLELARPAPRQSTAG